MKETEIFMSPEVYSFIERYSLTDTTQEIGGLLVGHTETIGNVVTVFITGSVYADYSESFINEMRFSSALWKDMYKEAQEKYPKSKVVGWFHTHPGMELKLSDNDRSLHLRFFNKENNLAMVYDPIDKKLAFYSLENGLMVNHQNYYIKPSKSQFNEIILKNKKSSKSLKSNLSLQLKKVAVFGFILAVCILSIMYRDITKPISGNDIAYRKLQAEQKTVIDNGPIEQNQTPPEQNNQPAVQNPQPVANNDKPSEETVQEGSQKVVVFTVKPGDSLWSISEKYYGRGFDFYKIMQYNKIVNPNTITKGSVLKIPVN